MRTLYLHCYAHRAKPAEIVQAAPPVAQQTPNTTSSYKSMPKLPPGEGVTVVVSRSVTLAGFTSSGLPGVIQREMSQDGAVGETIGEKEFGAGTKGPDREYLRQWSSRSWLAGLWAWFRS